MSLTLDREAVFDAIDSERQYQMRRWGVRQSDGSFTEKDHSVCDWLVYMQNYLNAAMHRASREDGDDGTLEELRKVVTLGIACFEQKGIKSRDTSVLIINGRDNRQA